MNDEVRHSNLWMGLVMAALVSGAIAFATPADAANLLTNGGFETEDGSDPLGWVSNGTSSYITAGTAGDDVYEGTHAVVMSENLRQWFMPDDYMPFVTPGTEYILSVYVKGDVSGDPVPKIRLGLVWFEDLDPAENNEDWEDVGADWTGIINVDGTWTEYSSTATAPSGAKAVKVILQSRNTVDVTFDNASLVPEPATMVLLGFGAAGLIVRRRRKHS